MAEPHETVPTVRSSEFLDLCANNRERQQRLLVRLALVSLAVAATSKLLGWAVPAVLVALGTASAALMLPLGSLKSRQIIEEAVGDLARVSAGVRRWTTEDLSLARYVLERCERRWRWPASVPWGLVLGAAVVPAVLDLYSWYVIAIATVYLAGVAAELHGWRIRSALLLLQHILKARNDDDLSDPLGKSAF